MNDGSILDHQITASSSFSAALAPTKARLYLIGSWTPQHVDANQWLQVEFDQTLPTIIGVILQGRSNYAQWVTKYRVTYSLDGVSWNDVKDSNQQIEVSICMYDRGAIETEHVQFNFSLSSLLTFRLREKPHPKKNSSSVW